MNYVMNVAVLTTSVERTIRKLKEQFPDYTVLSNWADYVDLSPEKQDGNIIMRSKDSSEFMSVLSEVDRIVLTVMYKDEYFRQRTEMLKQHQVKYGTDTLRANCPQNMYTTVYEDILEGITMRAGAVSSHLKTVGYESFPNAINTLWDKYTGHITMLHLPDDGIFIKN